MAVSIAVHKMGDYLRSELESRSISVKVDLVTVLENHMVTKKLYEILRNSAKNMIKNSFSSIFLVAETARIKCDQVIITYAEWKEFLADAFTENISVLHLNDYKHPVSCEKKLVYAGTIMGKDLSKKTACKRSYTTSSVRSWELFRGNDPRYSAEL